jgi:hypothetical protein
LYLIQGAVQQRYQRGLRTITISAVSKVIPTMRDCSMTLGFWLHEGQDGDRASEWQSMLSHVEVDADRRQVLAMGDFQAAAI